MNGTDFSRLLKFNCLDDDVQTKCLCKELVLIDTNISFGDFFMQSRLPDHIKWMLVFIIFLFVGEGSMGEVYAFDTDESLAPVLDIQFLQGTNIFY